MSAIGHHLALVVGVWHGLRVSKTLKIKSTDIVGGQLSVKRLKRSKSTVQPIHVDTDPLFDESRLLEKAAQNKGCLFPFSRQRVDQFIRKYGELTNVSPG